MKHCGYLVLLLVGLMTASIALTGCEGGSSDSGGGSDDAILGTWNVVTPWRWSRVNYKGDGTVDMTQRSDGALYVNAARWEISDGKLVTISDVRDECDYSVSGNTLTMTFPDSAVIVMVR